MNSGYMNERVSEQPRIAPGDEWTPELETRIPRGTTSGTEECCWERHAQLKTGSSWERHQQMRKHLESSGHSWKMPQRINTDLGGIVQGISQHPVGRFTRKPMKETSMKTHLGDSHIVQETSRSRLNQEAGITTAQVKTENIAKDDRL